MLFSTIFSFDLSLEDSSISDILQHTDLLILFNEGINRHVSLGRFWRKFENKMKVWQPSNCDSRQIQRLQIAPASSFAEKPLSAYKTIVLKMKIWPIYCRLCRFAAFSSVRHWILIEREKVRREGVWKLSEGLWRKGAKEGMRMPILSLSQSPFGIIIYYQRAAHKITFKSRVICISLMINLCFCLIDSARKLVSLLWFVVS